MRTTVAKINTSNLIHNFQTLKNNAPNCKVMAVVKANAYGHGAVGVSKALRDYGVEYLAVAFPSEAVELRLHGDRGKICVIVPSSGEDIDIIVRNDLEPSISTLDIAMKIDNEAKEQDKIIFGHLFLDTGMHRDGLPADEALEFMDKISRLKNLKIIGLMTHFAAAEKKEKSFSQKQLNQFNDALKKLRQEGYNFEYIHAANTAGIMNLPEAHFNMIRPGLGLYGLSPSDDLIGSLDLKPVMEFKSKVRLVKSIKAGDTVGYSFKFMAEKDMNIAVISMGYGDGYFVAYTNKGQCLINGKRYDLIGSVCMDQCMIDIKNDDIKIGDEVVFIGKSGEEEITAYDLAKTVNTIVYEIPTAINNRVPRQYY